MKAENKTGRDSCKASPTITDDGYGMLLVDCPECPLHYRVLKDRTERRTYSFSQP